MAGLKLRFLRFPSEAVVHGAGSVQRLQEQVIKTHQAGGKVYFLGLLDLPRDVWDSFLGSRCGVSYSDLDFYRRTRVLRWRNFRMGPTLLLHSGGSTCLSEFYCMRYCTTTLASAGLVVQPAATVCTATVSEVPAA